MVHECGDEAPCCVHGEDVFLVAVLSVHVIERDSGDDKDNP